MKKCVDSPIEIGKIIKESNYNDSVKSSLFSFFLDSTITIQKLSYALMSCEFKLSKIYESQLEKISDIQRNFNIDDVVDTLNSHGLIKMNICEFDYIYVSICIASKNTIRSFMNDDSALIMLGIDCSDCINFLIDKSTKPELDVFGNAISEKNRVQILDLMLDKNEITIRDIEQELGFTGTNAYYHLSLLIKASLIQSRNQGRTFFYILNKGYFDVICVILSKYSNGMDEKQ